jgi:WD40 repeat protein
MPKVAILHNILILSMSMAAFMYAQPGNDLYLFSLQQSSDGHYHVFSPKYLSGFNHGGEISQLSFTASGDLLVSARPKDGNQNDIWQLSPALKTIKRITFTSINEYSPKIQPGGQYLTVLHEDPGEKTGSHIYKIG